MKKITIFFSLIILCFAAIFYATPYWTLYQIKQAVDQNNAEALSSYIDYPSLRNNLKPQIQQQIQHKLGVDHPDNQIEIWGATLSEQLSNRVVDLVVHPNSIALLLQGKALKETIELPVAEITSPVKKWFNKIENILGVEKTPTLPEFNQKPNTEVRVEQKVQLKSNKESNESLSEKSQEKISMHYLDLNHFEVVIPSNDGQKTRFILQRTAMKWKVVDIKVNLFK